MDIHCLDYVYLVGGYPGPLCGGDVMMQGIGTAIVVVAGFAMSIAALSWFTILPAIGLLFLFGYLN